MKSERIDPKQFCEEVQELVDGRALLRTRKIDPGAVSPALQPFGFLMDNGSFVAVDNKGKMIKV